MLNFLNLYMWWLFLGGLLCLVVGNVLTAIAMKNNFLAMPNAMANTVTAATNGMSTAKTDEELVVGAATGFFGGAAKNFFGPFFKRMLPAMAFGFFTLLFFLGAVIGLIIRLTS